MCSDCLGFAIDSVSQKVPYSEDTARLRLLCGSVEVVILDPFFGFCSPAGGHVALRHDFSLGFWSVLIHGATYDLTR